MRASLTLLVVISFCAVVATAQDLFEAVKRDDSAMARSLIAKDPTRVNETDRYSLAPLHHAAMKGSREMVELLLAAGAQLDRRTRLNQTAQELALQHGHPEIARLLVDRGADPTPGEWPVIRGDFVGEALPGAAPVLFSPLIHSSILWDHGAPAFTRDGREVYWSVVFDDDTSVILGMSRKDGAWCRIEALPFSQARYRDVSPSLSADGKQLFFTSCRPATPDGKTGAYNMWLVERREEGWSEPRLLAPEIASGKDGRPFFPVEGVLYFGSWRAGSVKGSNIFHTQQVNGRFAAPVRLEAPFNTDNAMPTWVSADESCLIFESFRPGGLGGSDFWMAFRRTDGSWGEALNLAEGINSEGNDWFGGFSPDGKFFFFVSDRDGNNDVYWIDAKVTRDLIATGGKRAGAHRTSRSGAGDGGT